MFDEVVEIVAERLSSGQPPWTVPPPGTPRLLAGTMTNPATVVTSVERAGLWWRAWAPLRARLDAAWTILPLSSAEGFATAANHGTLILDAVHVLITGDAGGTPSLEEIATRLRAAGVPDRSPAEIFVAHAAGALADEGVVSLGADDLPALPGIEEFIAPRVSRRHVPVLLGGLPRVSAPEPATGAGFDPPVREEEQDIGFVELTNRGTSQRFAVRSDSEAFTRWCRSAGLAEPTADDARETHLIRVLALPGDTSRCLVFVDGRVSGPFGTEAIPDWFAAVVVGELGSPGEGAETVGPFWLTDDETGVRIHPDRLPDGAPADWQWLPGGWIGCGGDELVTVDAAAARRAIESAQGRVVDLASVAWQRSRPLVAVQTSGFDSGLAEVVASTLDSLRPDPTVDPGLLGASIVAIAESGRLMARAPVVDRPAMPVRVQEFTGYGSVELLGSSIKLNRAGVDDRRSTWWFRPDPSASPELLAERFGVFGIPHDIANLLGRADTGDSGFVLAADETPRAGNDRCKVYAPVVSATAWEELVESRPELGVLHVASSVSTRPSTTGFPLMVAWKFEAGSDRCATAVYRRHDGSGVTVAEAIAQVLSSRPDRVGAAHALVALDRDLADGLRAGDVEVIEDNGRSSVDIEVPAPCSRGERAAPAAWLASLCGAPPDAVAAFAARVAGVPVTRFIVGVDDDRTPFVSAYVA